MPCCRLGYFNQIFVSDIVLALVMLLTGDAMFVYFFGAFVLFMFWYSLNRKCPTVCAISREMISGP